MDSYNIAEENLLSIFQFEDADTGEEAIGSNLLLMQDRMVLLPKRAPRTWSSSSRFTPQARSSIVDTLQKVKNLYFCYTV